MRTIITAMIRDETAATMFQLGLLVALVAIVIY